LDPVLSDDSFIEDIDSMSLLGKCDHSVLWFCCNFSPSSNFFREQLDYSKGDYVFLCKRWIL